MKRLSLIISVMSAVSVSSAGVVGHWEFEFGGFLTDSSGNGNNLTITTDGSNGMTQIGLPGTGNGSDFPNPIPQTGSTNGSIAEFGGGKVGFGAVDSASIGQIGTNNTFTLEAFINAGTISSSAPEDSRYIVSQYNSGAGDRSFAWQINTSEGFTVFLGENGGGSAGSLISGTGLISSNIDYYVAVTYNSNTDTGVFYWQDLTNGGSLQSEAVSIGSTFDLHNSGEDLTIGFRPDSTKEWTAGALIDEVRVSDTVLGTGDLLISIPEPSTLMLSVLALTGGWIASRRRK